eukprot:1538885-Prymnesium_polylepis.1
MTGGFASVAGGVLAAYMSLRWDPNQQSFWSAQSIDRLFESLCGQLLWRRPGQPARRVHHVGARFDCDRQADGAPPTPRCVPALVPDEDGECGAAMPVLLSRRATHPDSEATYRRARAAMEVELRAPARKAAVGVELGEISFDAPGGGGSGGGGCGGGCGGGGSGERESDGLVHTRRMRMPRSTAANIVEAAADGAATAAPMVGAIVTNLIAFVSLVHFADSCVAWLASLVGVDTNMTQCARPPARDRTLLASNAAYPQRTRPTRDLTRSTGVPGRASFACVLLTMARARKSKGPTRGGALCRWQDPRVRLLAGRTPHRHARRRLRAGGAVPGHQACCQRVCRIRPPGRRHEGGQGLEPSRQRRDTLPTQTPADPSSASSALSLAYTSGGRPPPLVPRLAGFSNLGSMGIMIGALSGIFPPLKAPMVADITRALAAGTIACLSTACFASMLYQEGESGSGAEAPTTC